MAAQLERPNRVDRVNDDSSPINRVMGTKKAVGNITKKPITLNFICMVMVAVVLDLIGLFTGEIPGVGIALTIIYNTIFIPWFIFSGVKFNMKKIGSMGTMSILEFIPIVGNLPFMTLNIVYSYYSK